MSPLNVRRYRAERLLRGEFETLRGRVLATVRRRLASSGVVLDDGDLDACYSQAWQGLYMAILEGQDVANPAGWLVLASFRRGIEEHRSRRRLGELVRRSDGDGLPGGPSGGGWLERDLAGELDDRIRLRQLFEGLRGRLSARECEAAVLCYLQGLTRAQAAVRIGVSEARMRKLMEGGPGRPGVAAKVGALVATIRDGRWCEEQGSLMRGLAFGMLDPAGERHRLALAHSGECPACRAYVASLRGAAAVLPPVLLPWGLGASVVAGAPAGVGGAAGMGGAAGVGSAAGGGWLLAGGPVAAKLAVGCLLALGVGASCVELGVGSGHARAPVHRARQGEAGVSGASGRGASALAEGVGGPAGAPRTRASSSRNAAATRVTLRGWASREFGPEHGARVASAPRSGAGRAQIASAGQPGAPSPSSGLGASTSGEAQPVATPSTAGGRSHAEREFSPG